MHFAFTLILFFCYTFLCAQEGLSTSNGKVEESIDIDSTKFNRIILLDEIIVTSKKDYLTDSLSLRKQYASLFNPKNPSWKDFFSSTNYFDKAPLPYNRATNTTSSIISLNVLSLINFLGKNKSPETKLQKQLMHEEQERYLDHVFSSEKIQKTTGLQGDSLSFFIQRYRPSKEEIIKMSEYDILSYIKESFKSYQAESNP
ncbi:hypothetical protein RYH73_03565 [Olivibacter sp. CPCC 100613]|uniref:hypothetical protein n=1 Tax=Olivibacter sp. CPCC 100613 TaxID=3079931 RepID=UPI002FF64952